MKNAGKYPECGDERQCYARIKGKCMILESTYQPGLCPFCKPYRQFTKGNFYPDKAAQS